MSANPAEAFGPFLKLDISSKEGATVVKCCGKLTAEATALLRSEVKGLIPHAKRIVLDLTAVSQMDSSGLGAIVGLYVSARKANCEFQLINLSPRVRELLGMTNLLSAFESCGKYLTKIP